MAARQPHMQPVDQSRFHDWTDAPRHGASLPLHDMCRTRIGEYPPPAGPGDVQEKAASVMMRMLTEHPEWANIPEQGNMHKSAGCYPLHNAAEHANPYATHLLLKAGAEVNSRKNNGCTPLLTCIHAFGSSAKDHPMAGRYATLEDWESSCMIVFKLLLQGGCDISAGHEKRGGSGLDAIMMCVAHRYSRQDACLPLLRRLLARGPLLNSRWSDATALHFALKHGHHLCLELLLLAGADPTIKAGSVTAFECAQDYEVPPQVFQLVATAMHETAPAARARQPQTREAGSPSILRLRDETRRRAALTESLSGGANGVGRAHLRHADRARHTAGEFLQAADPSYASRAHDHARIVRHSCLSRVLERRRAKPS